VIVAWKYNTKALQIFVATEDSGSTMPGGKPDEVRYNDEHGNMMRHFLEWPKLIADYYEDANAIDVHNQVRQSIIGLKRNWVTQDGFFRIFTTILGMVLTDAWMGLTKCVNKCSPYSAITARDFVGCVLHELLVIRKDLSTSERPALSLASLSSDDPPVESISPAGSSPAASSISDQSNAFLSESSLVPVPFGARTIPENYRALHRVGKTERKGDRYVLGDCMICKGWRKRNGKNNHKSSAHCINCKKCFCKEECRNCYYVHICEQCKTSGLASTMWVNEFEAWKASFMEFN
jgi:hypothetical protein